MRDEADRYAPARRLNEVRAMLNSATGVTVYDIADRFEVSVRTAIRYLRALEVAGDSLYADTVDRKRVWRLEPSARHETITLTAAQMVALFLSGRVFDFLAGTGFKEDLDDVFKRVRATLARKDFLAVRNIERKIFDVNEAPHIYSGRLEDVNDITTALLRDHRLRVRHDSVEKGKKRFVVDPYTLLVYKKGLYLVAYSHHHKARRTFALDGFRSVQWIRDDRFEYPSDYDPATVAGGAFGLIAGPPTHVRIFFEQSVARFVRRRQWHPSQQIKTVPGGIELQMDVAGTTEVPSWVLGFGGKATVLEPATLRGEIATELRTALARYEN